MGRGVRMGWHACFGPHPANQSPQLVLMDAPARHHWCQPPAPSEVSRGEATAANALLGMLRVSA